VRHFNLSRSTRQEIREIIGREIRSGVDSGKFDAIWSRTRIFGDSETEWEREVRRYLDSLAERVERKGRRP
jgi:hypothetical protein